MNAADTFEVDWTGLITAQVIRYQSRVEYEARHKEEAPAPDFGRQPKAWRLVDLPADVRRFSYIGWAKQGEGLLTMPAAQETDPTRRQFYADYGILSVPYLEQLQIGRPEALAVNLPWDVSPAGAGPYADWMHMGTLPEPLRQLRDDEAFFPVLMSPARIVRMSLYRAAHPAEKPGAVAGDLREILAQLGEIRASLARIERKP